MSKMNRKISLIHLNAPEKFMRINDMTLVMNGDGIKPFFRELHNNTNNILSRLQSYRIFIQLSIRIPTAIVCRPPPATIIRILITRHCMFILYFCIFMRIFKFSICYIEIFDKEEEQG